MILLLGTVTVFADQVTCESKDNRRSECSIDTRGGVRLVRQLSDTQCREDRNLGTGRGFV
jgi:hypothetical protein